MENNESVECSGMKVELQKEHHWLQQLVGEWTYESEALMGPDKPPVKSTGCESARLLGGAWLVADGKCEMPDGEPGQMLITIGYDQQKKKFVGTWVGSMMTKLWVYEGFLNDAGTTLTLEAEGPDFATAGKLTKYRDIIEVKSADHRVFSSQMLGDDGQWHQFMTANYRRCK